MKKEIKSWVKQLLCSHYWKPDYTVPALIGAGSEVSYGEGVRKPYICLKCGKRILSPKEPINYIPF